MIGNIATIHSNLSIMEYGPWRGTIKNTTIK